MGVERLKADGVANISGILDEGEHIGETLWNVSLTMHKHDGNAGDREMSEHWRIWMHGRPNFGGRIGNESAMAQTMRIEQEPVLVDTASHAYFWVKVASVLCEVIAGVA